MNASAALELFSISADAESEDFELERPPHNDLRSATAELGEHRS
jgi:hypothetical protein